MSEWMPFLLWLGGYVLVAVLGWVVLTYLIGRHGLEDEWWVYLVTLVIIVWPLMLVALPFAWLFDRGLMAVTNLGKRHRER